MIFTRQHWQYRMFLQHLGLRLQLQFGLWEGNDHAHANKHTVRAEVLKLFGSPNDR